MGLKICWISKIRNNGVVLMVENLEQLRKLEGLIELASFVNIEEPNKPKPKVLIYDVPRDLDNVALTDIECTLEKLRQRLAPLFKAKILNSRTTGCLKRLMKWETHFLGVARIHVHWRIVDKTTSSPQYANNVRQTVNEQYPGM
ncbi:hypothetical protein J6590_089439 [Homalodisca vitripennis]|nr:hypothetical protein J6590_089439 [Homalodisca vitripennis]